MPGGDAEVATVAGREPTTETGWSGLRDLPTTPTAQSHRVDSGKRHQTDQRLLMVALEAVGGLGEPWRGDAQEIEKPLNLYDLRAYEVEDNGLEPMTFWLTAKSIDVSPYFASEFPPKSGV